jgi:ribose transport system ATP-binding protein
MGLAPQMTLQENLFLNPSGPPGTRAERRAAVEMLQRFGVRPVRPEAEVSTLSGGNAQKLLLSRCFSGEPRLVILTEPTAGVDVGAREAIYDIIRREAALGVGVLVITSDFPEVPAVCDRCVVFRRGRVATTLEGAAISVGAVASAAL